MLPSMKGRLKMTVEQYEKAEKIISTMERCSNEIDKLKLVLSKSSPYGCLEVKESIGSIRITVNVDMMKRCIWLLHDLYRELYEAKQKELEEL